MYWRTGSMKSREAVVDRSVGYGVYTFSLRSTAWSEGFLHVVDSCISIDFRPESLFRYHNTETYVGPSGFRSRQRRQKRLEQVSGELFAVGSYEMGYASYGLLFELAEKLPEPVMPSLAKIVGEVSVFDPDAYATGMQHFSIQLEPDPNILIQGRAMKKPAEKPSETVPKTRIEWED